jgi:hypothetical protein
MKPLFTQVEFERATTWQLLKLECEQCKNVFEKSKKRIQDSLRKHPKNGCRFCSQHCQTQHNTRVGKPSGGNCKFCKTKPAIYYSINTTGDFCSKICAYSYSSNTNKEQAIRKIKKAWKLKFIPKINHCISCNEIIKSRSRYCLECKKFQPFKLFYDKLGIKETNLKLTNKLAIEKFYNLYFNLEKSKIDLENEYGLNTNSIYIFSQKNGIQLRTVGEGLSCAFKNNKIHPANPKSNSFYHQGYYTGHTGQIFFYRSSYELKLATKLDEWKEYYEYEGISVPYDLSGATSYYLPDFYLPQHNFILEPKSAYYFKIDKNIYESQYNAVVKNYKMYFLFDKEIKNLEQAKTFNEYIASFADTKYF